MAKNKYKVLTTSGGKGVHVVEAMGVSKSKANKIAKKSKGVYCGASEDAPHKKIRGNKFIKGMHCERVKTKIVEMKL